MRNQNLESVRKKEVIMYYHASQTPNIKILTPHISNHGKPLIYFSTKRENTLVYLSNAVEKHCKQIKLEHNGSYKKWASYGFTKDGILRLEEYYPNATLETYHGISGYIYATESLTSYEIQKDIPHAIITECPVPVTSCEYIPDAYQAMMDAVNKGEIVLQKYEENSEAKLEWIKKVINSEYEKSNDYPEYREFLKAKFEFLTH